jgi:hypothetical protein
MSCCLRISAGLEASDDPAAIVSGYGVQDRVCELRAFVVPVRAVCVEDSSAGTAESTDGVVGCVLVTGKAITTGDHKGSGPVL